MVNKDWFSRHQELLLWLCNTPFVSIWFKRFLQIDKKGEFKGKKIVSLTPNSVSFLEKVDNKTLTITARFLVNPWYATRISTAVSFFSKLSLVGGLRWLGIPTEFLAPVFALVTDTFTPAAGRGRNRSGGSGWQAAHDANTGTVDGSGIIGSDGSGGAQIGRYFMPFDTSALPTNITLTAGSNFIRLQGTGTAKVNDNTDTVHIVASTQAAGDALDAADYDNIGTTSFSSIAISAYDDTDGGDNNFTLNTSGDAQISTTGYSLFAGRMNSDRANSAVAGNNEVRFYVAGGNDIILSVTYVVNVENNDDYVYTI